MLVGVGEFLRRIVHRHPLGESASPVNDLDNSDPRCLNRIDEQVVFRALDEQDIRKILKPMLDRICERVRERHGVELGISRDAEGLLVRTGFSPSFGARELRRTVERLLEAPFSQMILSEELQRYKRWMATADGQGIAISAVNE